MVEDDKPIKPLEERIAERNAAAEQHMHGMGTMQRFNAKAHLMYANTLDRTKTFLDNDNFNAWTGGALGAMRGFLLGAAAIIVMGSFFTAPGVVLGPLILAASTIGFGAYHAHKSFNESLSNKGEREGALHADDIARDAGAIPPRQVEQNVSEAQKLAKKAEPLSLPSDAVTTPAALPAMSHVEALRYRTNSEKPVGMSR